ncbi:MAG: hypothetical protein LC745_09325, partial [Planctomycetia bacterium]|nr:hypothetical protein [Planctomycetia bacterium]
GRAWTVVSGGTVFRGRAEFFTRDAKGACRALIFSTPGAAEPVERLRLLLCSRAAEASEFGPIVEGWRVRLGDGLHGEDDFREDVIAAALGDAQGAISRS